MAKSEKPTNDPTLEELERLGAERRPIAAWLGKLTELRAEVSPGVFDRVRSDYVGRLAELDRSAAPLLTLANKSVAAIDSDLGGLDSEQRGLDLDLQELALRHSLAELTDDELAERNRAPRERIAAIADDVKRAKSNRERWRSAIEQGFSATGDEAERPAPRPAPPSAPAPPASPRVEASAAALDTAAPAPPAPAVPDAKPRRIDITMPQPIPPPRPSSPAVPLPGPAAVEPAARTAHVAPIAPSPQPPASEAAGRTALFSPAPPAQPFQPAPAAPAADAAGRTSVFVPSPPPPPPAAAEAAGRTSLFSPAPPPDRTVVLGSVPPAAVPPSVAPPVPKARLVAVETTGPAAKEHPLAAENTLGRVPENSIPVPHGSVSRLHATLRYTDGAWWIVDQKSENGTWVNGERITERKLGNDDRINIGTVRFRFKID